MTKTTTMLLSLTLLVIPMTAPGADATKSPQEPALTTRNDGCGQYGFRVVRTARREQFPRSPQAAWPDVPKGLKHFPLTPSRLPVAAIDTLHARQRALAADWGIEPMCTNPVGMQLMLIPAGRFVMGSPENASRRGTDEGQHEVTLTRPYWMSAHEVTQEQYMRVMGYNPSRFAVGCGHVHYWKIAPAVGAEAWQQPVECVNWYDAVTFCNRLSALEGLRPCYRLEEVIPQAYGGGTAYAKVTMLDGDGYRLPSEAEWEYACRGDTPKSPMNTEPVDYVRKLPDLESLNPVVTGYSKTIGFIRKGRDRRFGLVYAGLLEVAEAGTYTFYTTSDDASSLYIDDTQVVDNGGKHEPRERSGTITLTAGAHRFKVHYGEAGGRGTLAAHWSGPGFKKTELTGTSFTPVPIGAMRLDEDAPTSGLTYAYYADRRDDYMWTNRNSHHRPHPVGTKLPNPFGLYDMLGNIQEWCNDEYGAYPTSPVRDPTGYAEGIQPGIRVMRGGVWSSGPANCRAARRHRRHQRLRADLWVCGCFGFRVVRNVGASPKAESRSFSLPEPPLYLPLFPANPTTLPGPRLDQLDKRQRSLAKNMGIKPMRTNSVGMKLVLIPPGTFTMGRKPLKKGDKYAHYIAPHQVTLTYAYWMAAHEVTQEQFVRLLGRNPSRFSIDRDVRRKAAAYIELGQDAWQLPVDSALIFDQIEFCNRLSEVEGLDPFYEITVTTRFHDGGALRAKAKILGGNGYRLVTDAEWEYACRAGSTTLYFWGDEDKRDQIVEYAWCVRNSGGRPHPVGRKKPNAFGLFDMIGNVCDGTTKHYMGEHPKGGPRIPYPKHPVTDPPPHIFPGLETRGGYWGLHGHIWAEYYSSDHRIGQGMYRWNGN